MEIVISIAAKIAEYTVAPIGQWLCYSFHYKSNIENLKNEEKNLQHAKTRVQHSVDDALRSNEGHKIEDDVKAWFREVDEITESATRILREDAEVETRISSHATCLNLKHQHQLSREANKIAINIVKHLEKGKFTRVSYLPASQDHLETTKNKNYVSLESRTLVVNGIMEALGDANINMIGVWGMPGVGKSTLMKEIVRRAKEEKLFHGFVLEVVTHSPELSRIRGEIKVMLNQESSRKNAKFLVILDDIWSQLDLEDVGIPSVGCKVVLTSRNRDVLVHGMGTEKNFELKSLPKEEAWNLFIKMAGDCIKNSDVKEVAIKVAEQCAGLPVALITVSKALKGQNLSTWKDAELRLKRPPLAHVPKLLSDVYYCIELSYNHLADEELKNLFLLCALLGRYIPYKDLLRYGFSLGLFQGIVTLEEARHRLSSLLCKLQDSCMLLESSDSSREFYNMHDVIQDIATIIASKDRNMFVMRDDGGQKAWPDVDSLKRCVAFSILGGDVDQLPNEMECPKLRFFHVYLNDRSLHIPDSLFKGMDNLNVLDLKKMQLQSLPSPLLLLRNLQTLCLHHCVLEDISGIGELKNLLILSLRHSEISKLPREVGSLVRLRVLDLSNCSKFKIIPPNLLSNLVKLEELYMGNSFAEWEVDQGLNAEREYANLAELKQMSLLTTLEIEIPNANNLPKASLFEKLKRYKICIGDDDWVWDWNDSAQFSRTLKLKLKTSFQLEVWIKMLLNRTEDLHLDELNGVKSVIPEMDGEGFQQLKHLHIQNNSEIKHIVNLRSSVIAFPILEKFVVQYMKNLEEIYCGKLSPESFKNLRVLKVEKCEKLRFVFSSSIAKELSLLEELKVTSCHKMVAIVVTEEEEDGIKDGDMILFCKLKKLVLDNLPELVSFLSTKNPFMTDCGEIITEGNHDVHMPLLHHQRLKWPMLKSMEIQRCEQIEKLASGIHVSFEETVGENIKQSFFLVDEHSFPSLEMLAIRDMERLEIIWQDQVATSSFSNIQKLKIYSCEKLLHVFQSNLLTTTSMQSLISLEVHFCNSLETIFGKLEGPNGNETPESRTKGKVAKEDGGTIHFVSTDGSPSLEKREDLPKKNHERSEDPNTIFRFQNLQEINVYGCKSLRTVFTSSVITCLKQLKTLRIENCGVEEIVLVEGEGGEAVARFVFPQLTNLTLGYLRRLKWFYKGAHVSNWPMLEEMKIAECDKVEIIASGVVSFQETAEEKGFEMSIKQPLFLVDHDKPSFPSLERLEIKYMKKLKIIWQDQVATSSFSNIQTLEISSCHKLLHVFQSNLLTTTSMQSLISLNVASPSLEKQEDLPKKNHKSEEPNTIFRFQNLQEIMVYDCKSLRSVFTSSVITCLKQLKTLAINNCGVEEIVSVEGEGGAVVARFVFPRVTKLSLVTLDRLKWFYKGVHVSNWPKLENIYIYECNEVEIFASGVVSFQEAVEERRSEMSSKQPLFLVDHDQLPFPSLKTLHIKKMDKLEIICQDQVASMSLISDLQILRISGCQQLRLPPIFQSNILTATVIQNLTELDLEYRQSLETIFGKHEGQKGKETQGLQSTFPNLEVLSLQFNIDAIWPCGFSDFPPSFLTRMPKLLELFVSNGGWEEIFPYELLDREIHVMILTRLRRLLLNRLPMLTHLWKEDTQPCPLFLNLEFLYLLECSKLRNLVPSSVFLQNLTVLRISNCHGLINLVTSSTARSLTQLEGMSVTECKRITEIVAVEGGEANHVAITFNKLEYLELDGLPNLTNFCSGAYLYKFPSLEKVIVRCCPEMKTFCQYGILETPKLKGVQDATFQKHPYWKLRDLNIPSSWLIRRFVLLHKYRRHYFHRDEHDLHWEHDLNTTIYQLWEADSDTRLLFRQSVENIEEDEDP